MADFAYRATYGLGGMPTESFRISTVIAATPAQIYEAWIDGEQHSAMTGSEARVDGRPGGKFTAWGGYIGGAILEIDPDRRIVQAWRTTEFPPDAADSRLEVLLSPEAGGTRLSLVHSGLPEGQGDAYRKGWDEFYFQPMKRYFARNAETERPPPSAPQRDGAGVFPAEGPSIVSAVPKAEREARRAAAGGGKKAARKPKPQKAKAKPAKKAPAPKATKRGSKATKAAARKATKAGARKAAKAPARKGAAKKPAARAAKPPKKSTGTKASRRKR